MAEEKTKTSYAGQVVGSLIVAVLIIVLTIAMVTAKLGPNSEDGGSGHGGRSEDHSGPG